MAFVILKTFIKRVENLKLIDLKKDIFSEIIQYNLVKNEIKPDKLKIEGFERPPMNTIPEYCEKFNLK